MNERVKSMLTYHNTCRGAIDWLYSISQYEVVFDTETDGLRYGSRIVGLSIVSGDQGAYINFNQMVREEIDQVLTVVYEIFAQTETLIGHNISYDLKVLKYYGILLDNVHIYDTMVAAHILNENKPCGLKSLMERKLKWKDVKEWKEVSKLGYDSHEFEEYGLKDSLATWELYKITKPLIDASFANLFYNIEMPFQHVLVDLESNGILVDQEYLEDLEDELECQHHLLEEQCIESIGMKMVEEQGLFGVISRTTPINLNSPKQLIKVIEEQLGLKLPYKSKKTGAPSTAKDSLEKIRTKHPFIDLLLQYGKVEQLLSTFVRPMWGHIYDDGRVRPSFNDCVARTGRLSSSEPNGQNLPKAKKDDKYKIRRVFVAREGYSLVHADWSGQELRVCGVVSNDEHMLSAFRDNKDLHLATANEWLKLGIPDECLYKSHPDFQKYVEIFADERHIGKNGVNFPIIYGTTSYGIAYNNDISEAKAQEGIDAFFRLYPKVKTAVAECRKQLFTNNYVETMLGRRRRFYEHNDKAIRQAFNFLIQGFCADLLRIAMVNLRQLLADNPQWDGKLVLTVHDSVVIECKDEFAEGVGQRMKHVMENSYKLPIQLPVDIKISKELQ
jgi:DNA polymerase-1